MLRGTCPPIDHGFDIWHMIKNIMKDVWEAGKLKKSADLNKWSGSVNNQLWWSFSSSQGQCELINFGIYIKKCFHSEYFILFDIYST